ncbi:hypothetical protein AGR5A_Cc60056 [Agrobacterium genomosp. 5 str. CFBP 6626]|nr:hypothetical protein AGR5A_Cc60056 [Agrobacterium genomosp. 5 str. CFBP 6626]
MAIANCDVAGFLLLGATIKYGPLGLALGGHERRYIKATGQRNREFRKSPVYRGILNFAADQRLEDCFPTFFVAPAPTQDSVLIFNSPTPLDHDGEVAPWISGRPIALHSRRQVAKLQENR